MKAYVPLLLFCFFGICLLDRKVFRNNKKLSPIRFIYKIDNQLNGNIANFWYVCSFYAKIPEQMRHF